MNVFSNIWNHPKTSAAGLLIAIVTIGGVLSGQGITLGTAGTGTIVTLICGVATALLGLLAQDPGGSASSSSSTAKLGAWMLIAVLLMGTLPVVGCTQAQKVSVAQEIVNWTPTLVSTVDLVNASVEALDPVTIVVLGPVTAIFNALAPQVQQAAVNYLANPSQTNIQLLQALIVQFQQNTNSALLAAARITNPTSQATATKNINLIATIANTMLALIQGISTKAQVAAMASQVHVTLAQVRPYMDAPAMQRASDRVAGDLALSRAPTVNQFFAFEAHSGF